MTKREIVKAAIAHQETGKTPYCIDFTPAAAQIIRPYFEGPDLLEAIGNYVYETACPWWDWFEVPESYYRDFDAPDYLPKTIGTGSYTGFREELQRIRESSGRYILVMIYGSHFEKAYFARGIENYLADLAGEREYAKKLLDTIIRKNMVMLENIVSIPEIDGILLGSDWGSQQSLLMDPKVWRELIAPGEKMEYDLIKQGGKDVWIHSCGNIEQVIPDLIEMGVDVLNPIQPEAMDIYGLKSRFGDRMTFWGGISTQLTLPYGTPDEVKREVEKVVTAMRKGGGYISAPAQLIQEDVPVENMLALIEKIHSFG